MTREKSHTGERRTCYKNYAGWRDPWPHEAVRLRRISLFKLCNISNEVQQLYTTSKSCLRIIFVQGQA